MRPLLGVVLLALAQSSSCDKPAPTATVKATPPRPPLHRFVLTRYPADSSIAFDTQTGQICKTWEWTPVGKERKPDESGHQPQRLIGEFAPTCLSIYEKYPSGPGDSFQPVEEAPEAK